MHGTTIKIKNHVALKENEETTRIRSWLRLALYSSHQKYKVRKIKTGVFEGRPTFSKKIFNGDELLVGLQSEDVGSSGEI